MLPRGLSPSGSAVGTSGLEFEEWRLVDFVTLVFIFPSLSVSLNFLLWRLAAAAAGRGPLYHLEEPHNTLFPFFPEYQGCQMCEHSCLQLSERFLHFLPPGSNFKAGQLDHLGVKLDSLHICHVALLGSWTRRGRMAGSWARVPQLERGRQGRPVKAAWEQAPLWLASAV